MTRLTSPDTFKQWLEVATRNLPAHIVNEIRSELAAHYQDAFDTHRHDGLTPGEAQQAAVAELGNAMLVNDSLITMHISRNHTLAAMLACMGYPLLLIVFPQLTSFMGEMVSYLFQDLFNTILLVYVLATFVRLISFNRDRLYRPVGWLMASLLLGTVVRLFFYSIFHRLPLIGTGVEIVWETGSVPGMILDGGFIAAEMLSAGACAWLGWRLYRIEEPLYGLLRPISILLMLICPVGAGVAISLLLGSMIFASYFSILGYVLVTLLMAIMILTFYRTTFRRSNEPFQTSS
jgi:hypothetical protein